MGLGQQSLEGATECRNQIDAGERTSMSPRKALSGGIPGAFLEPLERCCQFLEEMCPGFRSITEIDF